MKRGNRGIQGSGAGTGRVYEREGGERAKEWRKQLNIILLQAPVEATFKCASVLSGCRIT